MVADRMGGQLRDTKGIENFISMPYVEGNDLSGNLREHLQGYDIELLEPGLVDFGFNAGVSYRDEDGRRVYDDGDYNVIGYVRKGLSPTLTAGLTWEGNRDFDTVGFDAVWASPIGSFAINSATNIRNPKPSSSRLALQYSWRDTDRARSRTIDAQVVMTGEDYQTLNRIFGG